MTENRISQLFLIFTLLFIKIHHILPSIQRLKAAPCLLGLTEESWQLPALVSISLLNPWAVSLYCMCAHEKLVILVWTLFFDEICALWVLLGFQKQNVIKDDVPKVYSIPLHKNKFGFGRAYLILCFIYEKLDLLSFTEICKHTLRWHWKLGRAQKAGFLNNSWPKQPKSWVLLNRCFTDSFANPLMMTLRGW